LRARSLTGVAGDPPHDGFDGVRPSYFRRQRVSARELHEHAADVEQDPFDGLPYRWATSLDWLEPSGLADDVTICLSQQG
jgi:hypothetical protein